MAVTGGKYAINIGVFDVYQLLTKHGNRT